VSDLRPSDIAATTITAVFGVITGWMLARGPGAVVGGIGGVAFGLVAGRANVRPAITMTVFVGAMAGALIGASIVETICLPDSCVAVESVAAVVAGAGSFLGVGLVAALVTRSFDEYHEAVSDGREPPSPGCEAEPDAGDPDTAEPGSTGPRRPASD
jgi:hypothetical protein